MMDKYLCGFFFFFFLVFFCFGFFQRVFDTAPVINIHYVSFILKLMRVMNYGISIFRVLTAYLKNHENIIYKICYEVYNKTIIQKIIFMSLEKMKTAEIK